MRNLKYGTIEPVYKTNKLTDMENRLTVAGVGWRVGWPGSLGLVDAKYYIYNGEAM